MDFSLDELQQGVVDAARAFARGRLASDAPAWDAARKVPDAVWTELGELGLLSICVSEAEGGAGLDALALVLVVEELARASGSVAWGVVLSAEAGARVARAGDARALQALMDGTRLAQACEEASTSEGRLGLRALPSALTLTPSADSEGSAATSLRQVGAAAALVGLADAATDAALAYAGDRHQFGRPLSAFQAIQFKLADARTRVAAARLLTQRAAASSSSANAAAALAFASSVAPEVCSESLQVHGGYGYTTDFPVERQLRDATAIALVAASRGRTRAQLADALLAS